ncbi:MAG: PfkB family carbohydrate kinase, partial [Vicinamibacterales bacterium]
MSTVLTSEADKILSFEQAPALIAGMREGGRRVVQCHGTFDLLHPGHIHHLQEARSHGDLLVVTITADAHVNKGPGRPVFNEKLRAHTLAALQCVDGVVVVPHPTAVEAITCVKPDVYCKGLEYQDAANDPTGNIHDDRRLVEQFGGAIHYVGSVVFSSSKLLNNHFDHLGSEVRGFCRMLSETITPDGFRDAVASFTNLRVLVIGDVIFDRYVTVGVQGLTSKNRILSSRFVNEETQAGGAIAVARHVAQFTPHVRLLSLVGTEPWVRPALESALAPEQLAVLTDPSFTTVVKQRFVEPGSGSGTELSKLFSVNYLDADPPSVAVADRVLASIRAEIGQADVVLVADFGHGLLNAEARGVIQDRARLLMLNCQTNSFNHGFNIISRQYRRATAFTLDQNELMLACGRPHPDFQAELDALRKLFDAEYGWLTRGGIQTIGVTRTEAPVFCPPIDHAVTDTVGAGDAFFSVVALAAAQHLPCALATYIGQLAGANAVKIVGNARPISKSHLLKSG